MPADNISVLVGNLTDDPELRYTPNGVAVANFRLAITARVKERDGSWRNGETSFIPVNVWRETAENVAESLHKGNRAVVTGRLRTPHLANQRRRHTHCDRAGRRRSRALPAVPPSPRHRQSRPHPHPQRPRTPGAVPR
jgi:single stranded DNA-binding protein